MCAGRCELAAVAEMSGCAEGSANITCTDDPTLEPPYSDEPTWLRAVHALVATALMVVSILGNVLVLWLVVRNKQLQYRSIIASMGTVIVNISFSLVTNPQVLVGSITGEWPFGDKGCIAAGFLSTSFFYVRWLNICLIAVDRFLYIMAPFWYARNSKRLLVTLTVLVWTVPFLSNLPPLWLGGFSYRSSLTFCAVECGENQACARSYIAFFGVYLTIGMVVPTVLYVMLYCFGVKKRREMQRELGTQNNPPWESSGISQGNGVAHSSRGPRQSTELPNINEEEEEEVIEMEPCSPQPSHQPSVDLTILQELKMTSEHKILDTSRRCNGHSHLQWSSPLHQESTAESLHTRRLSEDREDALQGYRVADSEGAESLSQSEDGQSSEEGGRQLNGGPPGSRQSRGSVDSGREAMQTSANPQERRRSSLMVLSRAAISAVVPNRHRTNLQKRERRAMLTFVIIFTTLVITQLPLYFLSTTRRLDFYTQIPIWVHLVGVNLYLLAPALDPIIIMRNRDFKRVLSKMCWWRGSSSFFHSASS